MANDHLYLHVAEHPVGLKPHAEDVNLRLSVGTKDIRMIGIFGVGGIGKTTLAKAIYNSIAFRFEASCFLENVGDTANQGNRLVKLQKTLLSKILGDRRSLKADKSEMEINMIKRRLHSKRVLLILDGVDRLTQLEKLAGARDWFGEGSRIIITTRDKQLLIAHEVDSMYEMIGLNQDDAFELFCWHAFKRNRPVDGYGELVEQIIYYAGRLPLALKVLGSDLRGRSESEWVSAMDKSKKIPHQDIQKILQTSYDGLSDEEKEVFLDIACFFNGQVRLDDVIIKMLDSFGFEPNFSIPRLQQKCLISECDGKLQMHALLRDMGREVVRQQSPNNPGARSRLFSHDHVQEVLEVDTGPISVEAILADHFPEGHNIIHSSREAFKNMTRLKLFRCLNAHFSEELPDCLPYRISVLDWPNCPLQSMPSKFRGYKLFILRMPGSRIQEIPLEFQNLTVMNFRGCESIKKLSDVSRCPNLKKINLQDCTNLAEVHDSVGLILDRLVKLNLAGCFNLKSFPRRLQLRSLELLDLSECSSLQNFPEIECEMKHLSTVELSGTAIEELPSSIGYLTGLQSLDLCRYVNLKRLPSSIHELISLEGIYLNDCPNIISFGMEEDVFGMEEEVRPCVVSTSWENEVNSTTSLELYLKNSSLSKSNFFGPFHFFPNTRVLDLSDSDIVSIPASIKRFVRLWYLTLNDCKQLQEIKEFPPNLSVLRANGCTSLESLPEISEVFHFPRPSSIKLARCYKVNMGNFMANPAWNREANMIFPGNKIPDWFSYCKGTSNGQRCELNFKGSYNLDGLIGIAFCAVIEPVGRFWSVDMKIGSVAYNSNNYVGKIDERDSDHVWLWYLTREGITHKRGISLDHADHLRIIFESSPKSVILKHCGVHLLYKHHVHNVEDDENVDVHLDIAPIEDIASTLDIEIFLYPNDMCHYV